MMQLDMQIHMQIHMRKFIKGLHTLCHALSKKVMAQSNAMHCLIDLPEGTR